MFRSPQSIQMGTDSHGVPLSLITLDLALGRKWRHSVDTRLTQNTHGQSLVYFCRYIDWNMTRKLPTSFSGQEKDLRSNPQGQFINLDAWLPQMLR